MSAKQDDTRPRSKARDALDAKLDDVRIEIATPKVRASLFAVVAGVLAGLVPVLIALGMRLVGH